MEPYATQIEDMGKIIEKLKGRVNYQPGEKTAVESFKEKCWNSATNNQQIEKLQARVDYQPGEKTAVESFTGEWWLSSLVPQLEKLYKGFPTNIHFEYKENLKNDPRGCFAFTYENLQSFADLQLSSGGGVKWWSESQASKILRGWGHPLEGIKYFLTPVENQTPIVSFILSELRFECMEVWHDEADILFYEIAQWGKQLQRISCKTAGVKSFCKNVTNGPQILRTPLDEVAQKIETPMQFHYFRLHPINVHPFIALTIPAGDDVCAALEDEQVEKSSSYDEFIYEDFAKREQKMSNRAKQLYESEEAFHTALYSSPRYQIMQDFIQEKTVLFTQLAQVHKCSTCASCTEPCFSDPQYCSRCIRVAYCSASCQSAHWKAHKPTCQ